MASTSTPASIELLKGTWDYVDGENFDAYLQEMGISWVLRQAARAVKREKVTITQNENGTWSLKSESTVKNTLYDFIPGVEFKELRADGAEVMSIITFDESTGRWIHDAVDKHGRKGHVERYIDNNGYQQVEMSSGNVKARRWYRRTD